MKIEKIDIQTSNKKHATDIAILVDKLEFLQGINRLRGKWQVNPLYKTSDFDGFLSLNVHTKNAKPKEAQQRLVEFNDDIDKLLKRFRRGRNFKKVVEYALATGVVPEGIYQSCYFDIATINEPEDLNKPERYQYVIVMSPRTEKKEVEQAFSEFEEHIRSYEPTNEFETGVIGKINFHNSVNGYKSEIPTDRELIEQYHKGNVYPAADITKFKTQKELERTREWYWIRYEGYFNGTEKKPLSYPKILQEWQKTCKINGKRKTKDRIDCSCPYCSFNDINIIEQALPAYNRLLNQS